MRQGKFILGLSLFLCLAACTKDNEVGNVDSLEPDYVLPQGKSPDDNRIVDFYGTYGTYILYEFTERDFNWSQVEGSSSSYTFESADPTYVGKMLDLLEDTWFGLYSTDFNKKYLPYKIFLTSTLGIVSGETVTAKEVRAMNRQVAVAHCSAILDEMTVDDKLNFKNTLQAALWENWMNIMEMPEDFYEGSVYSGKASDDPTSPDYARTRGFIAYNGSEWSVNVSWPYELDPETDLASYLVGMVTRTSEEWASDLEYPLVKQKYDILRDWIQEKYGFDIQEIGNTIYQE